MDDEDDRRLLDFIGDVQALNDYLHGSNSKSIEEDDLTNAAYESASSFFSNDTGGSDEGLKDSHNHLEVFGGTGDSGLSSSLQFIEDELEGGVSPDGGVDLNSEDQPFDILQKSLLEADITEQTLAEEALLDSQPALCSTTTNFPQQLVSGGLGNVSATGLVAPMPLAGAQPQAFIQQVPQLPLPNGPAGHIQLVSSLNGSTPSMMTIKSLERPQILLRPGGNPVMGSAGQGTTFVPSTPGQVSVPFNKGPIQLQNIIIQRSPVPQSLVRPIQPKALQTGGQAVYNISNLGIQPNASTIANPANSNAYAASGSPQTTQQLKVVSQGTSIVVHPQFGQQGQPQVQASLPQGQFLLPTGSSVHGLQAVNGQMLQTNTQVGAPSLTSTTTYSILTNQNAAMQIIAGQHFGTGGQMIMNQGVVSSGQIGQASPTGVMQVAQRPGVTTKVWTTNPSPSSNVVQSLQAPSRLAMVNSTGQPLQTHLQISVSPGQRLLVPVAQNNTNPSHTAGQEPQFEKQQAALNQDSTFPKQKTQTQLLNLLGAKGVKTPSNQESLLTTMRPENQQLSRGGMVVEQLRRDHTRVISPGYTPFTSQNDAIERLLPYHVFQGELPCEEDFAKVDEEFEVAATQVLMRTQSMINKYRRLLMVEAERSSPSSEIVMIDRTFNQEERNSLTQDKRTLLIDPDGFLEEFCCGPKKLTSHSGAIDTVGHEDVPNLMETSPSQETPDIQGYGERTECHIKSAYRTEACSAFEDPGGGGHEDTFSKNSLDMKKKKTNNISSNVGSQDHQHFHPAQYSTSPSPSQHSSGHFYPSEQLQSFDPSHIQISDTDSVLEAAVNSILDC